MIYKFIVNNYQLGAKVKSTPVETIIKKKRIDDNHTAIYYRCSPRQKEFIEKILSKKALFPDKEDMQFINEATKPQYRETIFELIKQLTTNNDLKSFLRYYPENKINIHHIDTNYKYASRRDGSTNKKVKQAVKNQPYNIVITTSSWHNKIHNAIKKHNDPQPLIDQAIDKKEFFKLRDCLPIQTVKKLDTISDDNLEESLYNILKENRMENKFKFKKKKPFTKTNAGNVEYNNAMFNQGFGDFSSGQSLGEDTDLTIIKPKGFVELNTFRKAWKALNLSDEDLNDLQIEIMRGQAIPLGSHVYKIRFSPRSLNKGKDTATRVIYIEYIKDSQIYLVHAFSKSEEKNISPKELDTIRQLSKKINNEEV